VFQTRGLVHEEEASGAGATGIWVLGY
jgi:hypothetical protein